MYEKGNTIDRTLIRHHFPSFSSSLGHTYLHRASFVVLLAPSSYVKEPRNSFRTDKAFLSIFLYSCMKLTILIYLISNCARQSHPKRYIRQSKRLALLAGRWVLTCCMCMTSSSPQIVWKSHKRNVSHKNGSKRRFVLRQAQRLSKTVKESVNPHIADFIHSHSDFQLPPPPLSHQFKE
jgi:hypothetical protein